MFMFLNLTFSLSSLGPPPRADYRDAGPVDDELASVARITCLFPGFARGPRFNNSARESELSLNSGADGHFSMVFTHLISIHIREQCTAPAKATF
jgi:hypothetical protein